MIIYVYIHIYIVCMYIHIIYINTYIYIIFIHTHSLKQKYHSVHGSVVNADAPGANDGLIDVIAQRCLDCPRLARQQRLGIDPPCLKGRIHYFYLFLMGKSRFIYGKITFLWEKHHF